MHWRSHVQQHAPRWRGFGLAVQAYQTRVLEVIDEVARIARARQLQFMVRLVKGAYWDGEIKRAQEAGLEGYPVFTHKQHTDIAYLAAARALLGHDAVIVPQFATHNAGTIAAIVQMAGARSARFEMQRLHGMGEGVYREVLAALPELALRVYAPVGEHRDLLAYLVRRLLENGANSSFVHQLAECRSARRGVAALAAARAAGRGAAAADRPLRPGAPQPVGRGPRGRGAARAAVERLGPVRGADGARNAAATGRRHDAAPASRVGPPGTRCR